MNMNNFNVQQSAALQECLNELARYIDPEAYRTNPTNAAAWVFDEEATKRQAKAENTAAMILNKMYSVAYQSLASASENKSSQA